MCFQVLIYEQNLSQSNGKIYLKRGAKINQCSCRAEAKHGQYSKWYIRIKAATLATSLIFKH